MRITGLLLVLVSNIVFAQADTRSTIKSAANTTNEYTGTTYAVIVAVDRYDTLPHLQFAVKDATLFRNFLLSPAGGSVSPGNIMCYFDSAANTGALTAGCLEWLNMKKVKKGDRIFFYLAGHGDEYRNQYFYFTYDAKLVTGRRNYRIQGNIDITELKKSLLTYVLDDEAEVVFIIDACRVKAGEDTSSSGMARRLARLAENDIVQTKGFYSLYSTSGGSVAYESASIGGGHGYFTYYLVEGGLGEADIEAMGNKDGKITLSEFASYPKKLVPQVTEKQLQLKQGEGQVPEFTGQAAEKKILFTVNEAYLQTLAKDNIYTTLSRSQKDQPAVTHAAITRSADKASPELVKTFNRFLLLLRKKELYGNANSASAVYAAMKTNWPGEGLTGEARLLLVTELINFSKNVVDLYLLGADTKLVEEKSKSNDINAGFYSQLVRASVADFTTAASHIEAAIALLGADNPLVEKLLPRLWFLQARSHMDGNKAITLNEAISLAEKALSYDTTAVHLYHLLAMLEMKQRNVAKAEYYFVKAMEGETMYNKTALEVGYAFFKLKRFDEASIYYRLRSPDNKQFAAAYNTLALASLDAGNEKQAERYFKKGIWLDADGGYLKRNLTIYYQRKADEASRANKLLEAEYYHRSAAATMPGSAEVLINFGNFYNDNRVRQYGKARDLYTKCLQLQPNNTLALHNFAILYYNTGIVTRNRNFIDSAGILSRRILSAGGNENYVASAQARIANTDRILSKFQPSAKPLTDEVNPSLIIDTSGHALAAAKKLVQVKQFTQAEHLLRRLITKDPNDIAALRTMSELYTETEQPDSAILYMEKAFKRKPTDLAIAIDLAELYLLNDNSKKARQLLAPLLQADPYNATLVQWLGFVYEQEGNPTSAEAVYMSYYYRDPKNRDVLERLYEVSLVLGRSAQAEKYRREMMQVRK